MHAVTTINRIDEADLDHRGDSLAASSLPIEKKLDFLNRIAFHHTIFGLMAGAMTPEPDGQHFRSRAELADEASRLDVGEVVDVQIEIGHDGTLQDVDEGMGKSESDGESEAEADTEVKPEGEAKPKLDGEPETDTDTATDSDREAEADTEADTEVKPEDDTDPEADTETEADTEVRPEGEEKPKPDGEPETEPQPEGGPETEAETEPGTDTDPEADTKTEAEDTSEDDSANENVVEVERFEKTRRVAPENRRVTSILVPKVWTRCE
jgi:hypothetical protein